MRKYFLAFITTAIAASWFCCCTVTVSTSGKDAQKECLAECDSQYEKCVNSTLYVSCGYSQEASSDFHGTEKGNCIDIKIRCHENCVR